MGTFNKIKKYTKLPLELDEKIILLDCEMRKTKLGEAIANSTSGLYTITGFGPGDPAIPPIPEVPPIPAIPPTYEPVDPGPIADPNNFIWPEDQGDGSDPNAAPNIPDILYTTYNGEQVAAVRQIEGEYPEGVTPLAFALRSGWLSTNSIGYLSSGGFTPVASVGVFANASTDLGRAYQQAYNNLGKSGIFQYATTKTIFLWSGIDCLFGSCRGGAAYYPPDLTHETTPKADYVLYPLTLYIPTDANGNTLPNQFITDPGVPEVPGIPGVPGVPEGPPKPIVISRNALDDPNYFPGSISPQGDIAGMGPNQVYPLLDIIRSSPSGPTRNNAIQQLNQWAKPGSKNRELLLQLGVPLEGASLPTNQQQIAQIQPIEPAQQRKGTTGVGLPRNFPTGPIDMSPSGMNYPKEWLPKGV
jgi:hypothetical protein